jgi:hypothetical protein
MALRPSVEKEFDSGQGEDENEAKNEVAVANPLQWLRRTLSNDGSERGTANDGDEAIASLLPECFTIFQGGAASQARASGSDETETRSGMALPGALKSKTIEDKLVNDWWLRENKDHAIEYEEEKQLKEINKLQAKQVKRMLSPAGLFRKTWDGVQAFLLIYIAVVIPYRIGFSDDAHPWELAFCWDVFVDMYFIVDMALNFRTAVYTAEGELEVHPRPVAIAYLKSWFWIDLLGCLPLNYLIYIPGVVTANSVDVDHLSAELRANKALRLLRLARLLKIVRLVRFQRILIRWEEELYNVATLKLLKLVVLVCFVGHWLGCAFYFFGDWSEQAADGEWDMEADGVTKIRGWTWRQFGENAHDVPAHYRYVTSVYFAIMTLTTVGYGDITPLTTHERWYAIFAMLVGGFTFGMIVGSLADVVAKSDPGNSARSKKLGLIHAYLHERKAPTALTRRVRGFFSTHYDTRTVFDESNLIFEKLPDELRYALGVHMGYLHGVRSNGDRSHGLLYKVPFLQGLGTWGTIRVCLTMKMMKSAVTFAHMHGLDARIKTKKDNSPRTSHTSAFTDGAPRSSSSDPNRPTFFAEGEFGHEMYIVVDGVVQIQHKGADLGILRKYDFFGEMAVLADEDARHRRVRTAYPLVTTTVAVLSRAHDRAGPNFYGTDQYGVRNGYFL